MKDLEKLLEEHGWVLECVLPFEIRHPETDSFATNEAAQLVIDSLKKYSRVYVEGNNGGNFVDIERVDDNKVHLKVGDCCVHTINVVVTAEVLSNFLTQLVLQGNKNLIEVAKDFLAWDDKTNEKFLEGCHEET